MDQPASLEIRPVHGVDSVFTRRVVIVENVNTIRPGDKWDSDTLKRALLWCKFQQSPNSAPGLIVASANRRKNDFHDESFYEAWTTADASAFPNFSNGSLRIDFPGYGPETYDHINPQDDSMINLPMRHARFYSAEFFWRHSDCNSAWLLLMTDALPRLRFNNRAWQEHQELWQHFAAGDAYSVTASNDVGDSELGEVILLSGQDGEINARAFMVPRKAG
jgi:hypothetical protein